MVSAGVGQPDLVAGATGDTGKYGDDDVTMLDNHDANSTLDFQVSNTISGATVTLYAGDTVIGTKDGDGGTITVTTDGDHALPDGENAITATQTESGKLESAPSDPLTVHVDTVAPTASVPNLQPGSDTGKELDDDITKGYAPQFKGDANDPLSEGYASGLWKVEVTADNDPPETVTDTDVPGEYDVTLGDLDEGQRQVTAKVYDVAGNDYMTDPLGVDVDRTAPSPVSADEIATVDLAPGLTGTADDNYGIDTVVVRVYVGPTTYDEYSYPDVTFASGEWTLADTAIEEDLLRGYNYEIEVVVTDIAGNDGTDETSKELTTMIEGDANEDAAVDGADFTGWADNYEHTGLPLWKDGGWTVANWADSEEEVLAGEGTVDGADYTCWADNYRHDGSGGPPEGKGGGEGLDLDAKADDGAGVGGLLDEAEEPYLDYTVTDLGDGLYGYTFTLYGNDEQDASFFIDLTFEGVNGGEIQQTQAFGSIDVHTEAYAILFDGWPAANYDMDYDSWFYGPFSSFVALGEDDNYYHAEAGTGGGSEYEDADVAYIVCSGNLSVTGVASRLAVSYDLEVLATPGA